MNRVRPLLGVFAAIACVISTMSSCNILGPASYIAEGPPTIDAQHSLVDVPTVVLIDDRRNVVNPISLRRVIGDTASQQLMIKKILATTISPQDAMAVTRQMERNSQLLSLEEIGETVGAQQVIYVEMLQFGQWSSGVVPSPTAACYVKVVDVPNRMRVFPPPDAEQPAQLVHVTIAQVSPGEARTRSERSAVAEALATEVGMQVAKLFYKHERRELGSGATPAR